MGKLEISNHFNKEDKKIIQAFRSGQQDQQSADNCEEDKTSQADRLVEIGVKNSTLFHDDTKTPFAVIEVNDHHETWPIELKKYRSRLVHQYYESTGKAPGNESIRQALNVLEAKAVYDGETKNLSLRVAKHDGAIYYDLADDKWRTVKVEPGRWVVENNPPILFQRYQNTASQVLPQKGGILELLKKYVNLKHEGDWVLLVACLVSAFVPNIPHVISVFYGDKGSAKTTAQRVLKKIIDPAVLETMTLADCKNELVLTLKNNYAPCFDNLDSLRPWQSDMLCQAATGGGISKRQLYTDTDEIILSFYRCPLLNGINNVVTRDDLLDRSVLFQLERIDPEKRLEEAVLWEEFENDLPQILGAVFDILAEAMLVYPELDLKKLPRMADFARWGCAIAEAAGIGGNEFLAAYWSNIGSAVDEAIQADQVAAAIYDLMNEQNSWNGTATELLEKLSELPGVDANNKGWPKRPHILTRRINKMKSALAEVGIKVDNSRTDDARYIELSKDEEIESAISKGKVSEHDTSNQVEPEKRHENTKQASGENALNNKDYDVNDAYDAFFDRPATCD